MADRLPLSGYEIHLGRTIGPDCDRPFALFGNTPDGAVSADGRVIGTYLHGPLLPKNPWLADLLIAWALEYATGSRPVLEPLDDHLEEAAHAAAIVRTRQPNR